jgi:DNA-binding MarR family transcriptional regulator
LVLSAVPEVMRLVRQDMRARRPSNLTVPQFRTLLHLRRHPGTSISGIAEHLGLALSTTSHHIDALCKRNYVARDIAAADRRRATVSLTAQGEEVLGVARTETLERMARRLGAFSPEERNNLGTAMLLLMRVVGKTPERRE